MFFPEEEEVVANGDGDDGDGELQHLMVHLPNCTNGPVISLGSFLLAWQHSLVQSACVCMCMRTRADHVTQRLQDLEQSVSLKEIRQLFDGKEYSVVVHKLELYLEYNTVDMPTDVSGLSGPFTPQGMYVCMYVCLVPDGFKGCVFRCN